MIIEFPAALNQVDVAEQGVFEDRDLEVEFAPVFGDFPAQFLEVAAHLCTRIRRRQTQINIVGFGTADEIVGLLE